MCLVARYNRTTVQKSEPAFIVLGLTARSFKTSVYGSLSGLSFLLWFLSCSPVVCVRACALVECNTRSMYQLLNALQH
jgi:hypothetical protein